jgi:hypothetical protein
MRRTVVYDASSIHRSANVTRICPARLRLDPTTRFVASSKLFGTQLLQMRFLLATGQAACNCFSSDESDDPTLLKQNYLKTSVAFIHKLQFRRPPRGLGVHALSPDPVCASLCMTACSCLDDHRTYPCWHGTGASLAMRCNKHRLTRIGLERYESSHCYS